MFLRLLLIIPLLFFSCGEKSYISENISDINAESGHALIEKNKGSDNFVIIDVRTPGEFNGGHLAGAVNINSASGDFSDRIQAMDRNKIYLVYCRTSHRSSAVMPLFQKLGFKRVYNLEGGIVAWVSKGYEVVK